MLETNGYNLSSQQRAVIDYMRSVYQIDDIKVRAGGKHLHVEYVYAGRRHKDTFPRGRGLDPNWVDTRKHDLRKELGSPPADLPQPTKRNLDDMTQEVQARADLLSTTAAGAVIRPAKTAKATIATGKTATAPPPVPHQHYGCTIGVLKNSSNIAFYLGLELYAAMELQFGKGRHYAFTYHHPNTWTARPSRDAGQIIDPANHRLRCGGIEAIKRLGQFSSTKANAVIHHNRVEFRMMLPTVIVKPQTFIESVETIEAPPEPVAVAVPVAVVTAPMSPAELVPFVAGKPVQVVGAPQAVPPAPAPPAPPADPRERLRHVLRLIRAIEEEGVYRLIPSDSIGNSNGWRWRATDIGLED